MNNLLLAILLKNFRWLKIRLTSILKQSLNQLSKVFIVRFHVIQFTRYSVARWRSFCVRCELLYVSTTYLVCQELFSSFLKNFLNCGCPPGSPFIRQLSYTSTMNRVCQALFTTFHKILFILLCSAAVSRDSLPILAPHAPVVNKFS